MSKHWKPGRQAVPLRVSQIRRDPVRLESKPTLRRRRTAAYSREREIWLGVAGILFFAVVLAVLIVGVSAATIVHDDPASDARATQFDQCYNGGSNCVVDGDTIYVAGEKVVIAGIDAPEIQGALCADERSRGIDAAVRLANLLNSGSVTLGAPFRDAFGREVRSIQVRSVDVAQRMLNDGLVREYTGERANYCS